MTSAHDLTKWMYIAVPSLSIALLVVSGNSQIIQGGADGLFQGFIQNASLRFYLFVGLIYGVFGIVGLWAVYGIERHGRRVGEVLNE